MNLPILTFNLCSSLIVYGKRRIIKIFKHIIFLPVDVYELIHPVIDPAELSCILVVGFASGLFSYELHVITFSHPVPSLSLIASIYYRPFVLFPLYAWSMVFGSRIELYVNEVSFAVYGRFLRRCLLATDCLY